MQDIREVNNLIKEKLKTEAIDNIYATIAHNRHLPFATSVKLGAVYGEISECDTYAGWNSRSIKVRKGEHSKLEVPEREASGYSWHHYFSIDQTTADSKRNKRTLNSLVDRLNEYNFMQTNAEKLDFSAIIALVRTYARETGILFDTDLEPFIVSGIASILAHTCNDCATIEITPMPFPEREYSANAQLLKDIGGYASELLELVELYETKDKERRSKRVTEKSAEPTSSGTQIDLFNLQQEQPISKPASKPESVVVSRTGVEPFYQRYIDKEATNPGAVVAMRIGDFYEILGENAKAVAQKLDITLLSRLVGLSERVPMCGFPFCACESYFNKILETVSDKILIIDEEHSRDSEEILLVSERKVEEDSDTTNNEKEKYEAGRSFAKSRVKATGEPHVTIEHSENTAFNTGDVFSFFDIDNKLGELDKTYSDLGYDKVRFTIDYIYKGEETEFSDRYDIGDKENGLLNHISTAAEHAQAREERDSAIELVEYLKLHNTLSERFNTAQGNSSEIRDIYNYIKTTRATLNATEHIAEFGSSLLPKQAETVKRPETDPTVLLETVKEEQEDIASEEQRLTFGGQKTRFKDNIEALKVYKKLKATGEAATPAEKAVLKKYVGWGGISEVFDPRNSNWQEERKELSEYLSPSEYNAAAQTVTDAFYTPFTVVKGIYSALEHFGVKGNNRILEPSMGIGNFFRVMPESIKSGSELYGVEIDPTTGGMARLIYPNAKITVKGFEKVLYPENNFDVVIGNVPFGNSKPNDIERDYDFNLHDFIIAKSVDKVRPGGIVALVTTSTTLDGYDQDARQYIADRAELIGAMRLPYDAFKATANTTVSTDIIFLRKREEIIKSDDSWIVSKFQDIKDTLISQYVNSYFSQHPEMILGELVPIKNRYGQVKYLPQLREGETLSDKISEAIKLLPQDIFTPIERDTEEPEIEQIPADESIRNFCYAIIDDKLYQRQGDVMLNVEIPKTPKDALSRIKSMIELRNEVRRILKIQIDNCSDNELKVSQVSLNSHYDEFVKKYGTLHSSTNKNLFSGDADVELLLSLEFEDTATKKISKADIFTKRSITPTSKPQHTDSSLDALQVCKSERGVVDLKYIEQLTGKDFDTVVSELSGKIFKNPREANDYDKYCGYEASETYLSGDVKTKLQEAINAARTDEAYQNNVRALEEVQPAFIPAEDIILSLGATWIDVEIYEQFICEAILKIENNKFGYGERVSIAYSDLINGYTVDSQLYTTARSEANTNTYGTPDIYAVELFEQALNLKSPNIYDASRDADGKPIRIFNPKKTALAREKQTKIKAEFSQWIFSDPSRREYLTNKYNDMFNRLRLPQYDGSNLTFPEMNPEITLNPHQKNAIYRGMAEGTMLLHHCVGAGKTFEMDALTMKLRQSGLAHKPLHVVPKATLEQAESEFRRLYPNANILVASNDDFKKNRLKAFTAKIALGDWDCIIMSSSQFDRINVSPERQAKKEAEEIEKITTTLTRAKKSRNGKDDGLSVKRLQGILKKKRANLERLMKNDNVDDFIRFEDLGIDYLFIDEAHYYKNKYFFTKMSNVAGINSSASKRASALDLKIDYINELHGGDKGVIFATGTPISNSMSEMYTMQSYLQKSRLAKLKLDTFDDWASTFGEIVKSYEVKPAGNGYRTRERFASFVNVPELMTMYGLFADVKMLNELNLQVPNVKYEKVIAPKTEQVEELMRGISERAERINKERVDPSVDNMLKITTDGKKIALDPRLFNPELLEEEGGKLQLCAEKVAEIYHATAEQKSTQMIFCDSSTPQANMSYEHYNSKENFNVYYEIKNKLIALGVAANEIAFIHDYEDKAKITLREEMNAGNVRVLIGSTSKCGTGLNVQKKLIAGHHLDIPYRPSDMEQREGRIIRQGNENKDVTIYTYAQEGTFDVYLFQILETKQKFIKQLLDFKVGSRKIDDIADNAALSYSEMKAAISGNPEIIELEQLRQKEDNLRLLQTEYRKNLYRLQNKIEYEYPSDIKRTTENIQNLETDLATVAEHKTDDFIIKINGRTFKGRTEEVGAEFMAAYNAAECEGAPFAEYSGMTIAKDRLIRYDELPKLVIRGAGNYLVQLSDSGVGALTRLYNAVHLTLPDKLISEKAALSLAQANLEEAKQEVQKPFAKEEELTATLSRIDELKTKLEISNIATDDVVIDTSVQEPNSSDNNYMRLPLEFMETDEIARTVLQHFSSAQITAELEKRKTEANDNYISDGIDYEKLKSYSTDVLRATLENLHKYITKRGFFIEDLIQARNGITDAIVHRVIKNEEGKVELDDYLIALNYNIRTGEWVQGRYDYSSLRSATDSYYKDITESVEQFNNMYYQNILIKQNEVKMQSNQSKIMNSEEKTLDEFVEERLTPILNSGLSETVKDTISEERLKEFLTDAMQKVKWLGGEPATYDEDDFTDLLYGLRNFVKNSEFNKGGDNFNSWYAPYSRATLLPIIKNIIAEKESVKIGENLTDEEKQVIDDLVQADDLPLLKQRVKVAQSMTPEEIQQELSADGIDRLDRYELEHIVENYKSYSSSYASQRVNGWEAYIEQHQEEYAQKLLQAPLFGVIYNWKGLKEENSLYTLAQLKAHDQYFNPELDRQDGAFATNKTYIIYKLNGAMGEETAANVKAFLTGSKNDNFDGAEMPDGWYWETTTDNLFTGEKNQTAEVLIKHFNLSEQDLIMPQTVEEREHEVRNGQIEREQEIAREDYPKDFEDELTETLLDDAENHIGALNNPRGLAPKSVTTLGEDLANAPMWHKVNLPLSSISIKGEKNIKIKMPDNGSYSGAEFWVSKKFVKNATDKDFNLVLPNNYTVRLKTAQGGDLSVKSSLVIEDLKNHDRPAVVSSETITPIQNAQPVNLDNAVAIDLSPDKVEELHLSALRQELVTNIVSAMERNDIEWLRVWATSYPRNGSTGREYSGINNILLSMAKEIRGYTDDRWCTFNQIKSHNWKLKKGSKAAQIEVVKFMDKTTKKEFTEESVAELTEQERKEYWENNVYPIMKSYAVFNADCIEGIPADTFNQIDEKDRNIRCEKIINNSPAKIAFDGGNEAYYSPKTDTIHLPKREKFYSVNDFYHVALHEIGHSTGHVSRLNRDMTGMMGSEKYAQEELCAELGSLFVSQNLGIEISEAQLKSSAAYLKGWATRIKKEPKFLFKAISEANKISKYVLELQASSVNSNKIAAEQNRIDTLQRGGKAKQIGLSAFIGKRIQNDKSKPLTNSKETNNIME